MFNVERWQEIFEAISKNKLRTILTSMSVASGIFILVILLGFSSGIQNGVRKQFEQDATNRIQVSTRVTSKGYKGLNPGRRLQLRNGDYNNLTEKYEDYIEYKTPLYSNWGGQINYKQQQGNYRIEGAEADQQYIENQTLVSGRFISQQDVDENRKVAVIGYQIKEDLFKQEDPIGKTILLNNNINYKVIGVYTDPGGTREESRAFIPISSAQQVFNAGDNVNRIAITVEPAATFDETVERSAMLAQAIDNDLRTKFIVAPDDRIAVRVDDTLEEAKKIFGLIDTIRFVFWFIGIGTIIAGVVGVGNIMIIIVRERTKEIGIRKALGALPSEIIFMVLQEAIFITLIAGLLGLFAGVGLLQIFAPYVEMDFIHNPTVDFTTVMTTVFILVVAGALAGFIPARRAANIKPIEALRDE
ncbi:ABC transporter permease protein [Nonlabens tegetincola]|uniref:ABC transporter permease protein n=3 Tax=Nonlabens tegetincola TaxID=323273 RepID=A0A090Q1L5_9FLAO|nr:MULTISPECIES: ABC transporter permease [Nonlabens]MEE2802035.1 ABC transporter permease [Bacteroidota bacterium]ALM21220.1 ABC transporter ATP-binding protein [Nonlabens sp. MIC269]ARN72059.1 ABC transporter ATP-binding protein [Nonlabens tegetincola]PQJ20324.1 ABC transporter ATP-binding protein [Nonlabens tegetincola]GAK96077.1 ABC transporter permease protein [Nonlabens tegetincola]